MSAAFMLEPVVYKKPGLLVIVPVIKASTCIAFQILSIWIWSEDYGLLDEKSYSLTWVAQHLDHTWKISALISHLTWQQQQQLPKY